MEALLLLSAVGFTLSSVWEHSSGSGSSPDSPPLLAVVAACLLFAAVVGLTVPCYLVTGSLTVRSQPDVDPPSQKKGKRAVAPSPEGEQASNTAKDSAAAPVSAHAHCPGSQITHSSHSEHCDEGNHDHQNHRHHHQQQQVQQRKEAAIPVHGPKRVAQQEQGMLHGLLGMPCAILAWTALMNSAAWHAPTETTDLPHHTAAAVHPSAEHELQLSIGGPRVALAVEASVCSALWVALSIAVPWLWPKCVSAAQQARHSGTRFAGAAPSRQGRSSADSMPHSGGAGGVHHNGGAKPSVACSGGAGPSVPHRDFRSGWSGRRGSPLSGHGLLAACFVAVGLLASLLTAGIEAAPSSSTPTSNCSSSSSNSSSAAGDQPWRTSCRSAPSVQNCTASHSTWATQLQCPAVRAWVSPPAAARPPPPLFPAAVLRFHSLSGSLAPLATHALLTGLPNTFTLGEAMLLVQAALQALHSVATHAATHCPPPCTPNPTNPLRTSIYTIPAPKIPHQHTPLNTPHVCTERMGAQPALPLPALSKLLLQGSFASRLQVQQSTAQHAEHAHACCRGEQACSAGVCSENISSSSSNKSSGSSNSSCECTSEGTVESGPTEYSKSSRSGSSSDGGMGSGHERAQCRVLPPALSDLHTDLSAALEAAVAVALWAGLAGWCTWGLYTLFGEHAQQQLTPHDSDHHHHHHHHHQQQQQQQQQAGQAASTPKSSAPHLPPPSPSSTHTSANPTAPTPKLPASSTAVWGAACACTSSRITPVWVAACAGAALAGLCWAGAELVRLAAWTLLAFLPGVQFTALARSRSQGQCPVTGSTSLDAGQVDGIGGGGMGVHNATLVCRVCILGYWAAVLGIALVCQAHITHHRRWPLTAVRKGYHLLVLLLFVPILLLDPPMLVLSLAIAFAALLCLELARATRTPLLPAPMHSALHTFMSHFVDARDLGGPLFVTHMALLLGCAVPIWVGCSARIQLDALASASCPDLNGSCNQQQVETGDKTGAGWHNGMEAFVAAALRSAPWLLIASAGLITLGVGDTAASVIGSWCGRTRVRRCAKKTWEGLGAGAAAMLAATLLLLVVAGLYGGRNIDNRGILKAHHWSELVCSGGSYECLAGTPWAAHEGEHAASERPCSRLWREGGGGHADGGAYCGSESRPKLCVEGDQTPQCQTAACACEPSWQNAGSGRHCVAGMAGAQSKHRCKPVGGLHVAFFVGDLVLHVLFSALLEALTQQLDNLVLPLWHMTSMVCVLARALPL